MKFRRFDCQHLDRRGRALLLACMTFWSIISYLVCSRFVIGATEIIGNSMAPTLRHGERYIVNRLIYRLRAPRRGDIVAVRVPEYAGVCVKRVIALPGEEVEIRGPRVFIDGAPLEEAYLAPAVWAARKARFRRRLAVPPGCYFVLGDNRPTSVDSREFGAVRREWILGTLWLFEPWRRNRGPEAAMVTGP